MNGRRTLPILLLCLLLVLTVGGAVLGLLVAPSSATVAATNGAGEDLLASVLVAQATQQEVGTGSNQQAHITIRVVPPAPYDNTITGTGPGDTLIYVLRRIAATSGWAASHGTYHFTGTPAEFLGGGQVPPGARLAVVVTVHNGYATDIVVASRTITGQGLNERFRLTKIGDYRPPPS